MSIGRAYIRVGGMNRAKSFVYLLYMDRVCDGELVLVFDDVVHGWRACAPTVDGDIRVGSSLYEGASASVRYCLRLTLSRSCQMARALIRTKAWKGGEDTVSGEFWGVIHISGSLVAHLVSPAVVVMVVGGERGDDVHALFLCSGLYLGNVVYVDGGGFLCAFVDEQVGVVV